MSLFGTGRREGILAVSLLALCAVAVHLPGLVLGSYRSLSSPAASAPLRAQLEGTSNHTILLPALEQAGAALRDGDMPLWNQGARFGEPFVVSGAPVWYPPYWLVMCGLGPWALELLFALHTVIASVGMFRFLRVMPTSRYVAFLGGSSYGMGWFLTAGFDRLPEAAAAALLPIALECTWRCLASRRRRPIFVPALGLALAAMFATGSTTTAWFGATLCAGMLLAGIRAIEREHRPVMLGMVAIAATIACLLTAPLWLDHWQLRGHLHVEDLATDPARLQPTGLLAAFAPGIFADLDGTGPGVLAELNPAADPLELALYPGALVLFLLVLGLFRPKRSYQELFWLTVAGFGLVLAVDSPLHTALGWSVDRPGAGLVWFHLAAVVLAARHLETFFDAPIARPLATPMTCGLALSATLLVVFLGGLSPDLGDSLLRWALGGDAASLVELSAARAHLFERALGPALALGAIALAFCVWRRVGILRFKPMLAAIALIDVAFVAFSAVPRRTLDHAELAARAAPGVEGADRSRTVHVGRDPNPLARSALPALGVARVDTHGRAILQRTAEYLSAIDPSCVRTTKRRSEVAPLLVPELLDHPLLARAHVDIARSTQLGGTAMFEPLLAAPGHDLARIPRAADGTTVLMRSSASPRVRLAFLVHPVADRSAAMQQLRDSRFPDPLGAMCELDGIGMTLDEIDSAAGVAPLARMASASSRGERHEAAIAADPTDDPSATPAMPNAGTPKHTPSAHIALDRANRVVVHARLDGEYGLLALADAIAPGWEVAVDGRPARLLASDVAFRAVVLPPGHHEVVFRYRPWSWLFGVPMLAAGLVLCLGAAFAATARHSGAPAPKTAHGRRDRGRR